MKLLNLGCGGQRPKGSQWINLDDLQSQLAPGTGAREALDQEANYINFVVGIGPLPFEDNSLDGLIASHFFEHFDCQQAANIMRDCRRILKPGGLLLVSVPDASYFRRVHHEDRNENWPRLFEVTDPANPIPTFFEAALWFDQHRAVLTEDALWCYLRQAGFERIGKLVEARNDEQPLKELRKILNRRIFSLEMLGIK